MPVRDGRKHPGLAFVRTGHLVATALRPLPTVRLRFTFPREMTVDNLARFTNSLKSRPTSKAAGQVMRQMVYNSRYAPNGNQKESEG